jgi:hypothetical protein
VLSQVENFTLMFLFLGLTVAVLSLEQPQAIDAASQRHLKGSERATRAVPSDIRSTA